MVINILDEPVTRNSCLIFLENEGFDLPEPQEGKTSSSPNLQIQEGHQPALAAADKSLFTVFDLILYDIMTIFKFLGEFLIF